MMKAIIKLLKLQCDGLMDLMCWKYFYAFLVSMYYVIDRCYDAFEYF